jgi:hypothetical protein
MGKSMKKLGSSRLPMKEREEWARLVFCRSEPLEKKTEPLGERERERYKYASGPNSQLSAALQHSKCGTAALARTA